VRLILSIIGNFKLDCDERQNALISSLLQYTKLQPPKYCNITDCSLRSTAIYQTAASEVLQYTRLQPPKYCNIPDCSLEVQQYTRLQPPKQRQQGPCPKNLSSYERFVPIQPLETDLYEPATRSSHLAYIGRH